MSNAALAFFSGLAGGYVKGKQDEDEKARRDKREQRDQEEHDARMAELAKKFAADKALRDAATPATVSTGATVTGISDKPTVYDNVDVASSDVRQAQRLRELPAAASGIDAPPAGSASAAAPSPASSAAAPAAEPAAAPAPAVTMTPTPVVNGTAFGNQASAQAAADAANTPQAIRARQVAALQGIDPERAMKLEASTITLDNARAEQAKRLKDEGVFDTVQAARRGDAQGVFDSFNKNGKFKLQGVPTVTPEIRDIPGVGKIQTYTYSGTLVGPDGSVQPFQKNSHDLSLEVMPYEKALDVQMKGTKEQREGRKDQSIIDENNAKANYYNAAAGAQTTKANKGAEGKPFKLDEDDKLRLTNVNQRVRDAEKAVADAMGKLMPGDDPTKSPGVVYAQGLLRQAKLDHLKTSIELGQIPAATMVTQIMGVAKGPQDVLKSLGELATVGGTEYADQVAAEIQKTDQWQRWNPAPKPKAGGGRPAAAAGIPAPAATPAAAAPGGQKAATRISLPDAQQKVRAAEAKLATYGLRQRQQDPTGYQRAQEEAEIARAMLDAAESDEAAARRAAFASETGPYIGGRRAPAAAAGMTAGR